ncbi:hypothetical protein PIB30_042165 [Stylosanthes scabra]|uniref:Uncharacterized protein n=1 Tax=Stylosanthes scabra TaxID=79078 RepID=A0ABU6RFJ1_9FABA|nr:hypothetical protein [Stylosanthes scabra]
MAPVGVTFAAATVIGRGERWEKESSARDKERDEGNRLSNSFANSNATKEASKAEELLSKEAYAPVLAVLPLPPWVSPFMPPNSETRSICAAASRATTTAKSPTT